MSWVDPSNAAFSNEILTFSRSLIDLPTRGRDSHPRGTSGGDDVYRGKDNCNP